MSGLRPFLAGVLLAVAACGGNASGPPDEAALPAISAAAGELTVFAGASLTDAFEAIGAAFEIEHPNVSVTFSFAGSQALATQIVEGAPADVLASANQSQMDRVDDAGLLSGGPQTFAENRLTIAVERGNPTLVEGLQDLGTEDLKVVLAAEEVPAGEYARAALDAAGVPVDPVSLETDVRAVLTKVTLGEADAGIVYESDLATARHEVDGVEIPDDQNVTATYPIAVLSDAPNPGAAAAFVAYVMSDAGQQRLEEFGLTAP